MAENRCLGTELKQVRTNASKLSELQRSHLLQEMWETWDDLIVAFKYLKGAYRYRDIL